MPFFRNKTKGLRYTVAALIILSIGLLLWQHFGMTRVLRIDLSDAAKFSVQDDRPQGGKSIATIQAQNNAMVMSCQLAKSKYEWPYCQISIALGKAPNGINLSVFDDIAFDVAHNGPKPDKIRVYLNNFEADSTLADPLSLKVNELLLDLPEFQPQAIPLKLFHVASWWVEYKNKPLLETDMRINNVPMLILATPGFAGEGLHQIVVRSIEFRGKWIKQLHLLQGIVAAWILLALGWLLNELLAYRHRVQEEQKLRTALQNLNNTLELEAKELSDKVITDPLTGALNREGFYEFLQRRQGTTTLSVLFVDLDFFKKINDVHGHAIGDEVLRQFAGLIKNNTRQLDRLVRWGGEEFLILCPDTDLMSATRFAEKLRLIIAAAQWPNQIGLTCSCGVATRLPEEQFDDLLARADAALYRAKAAGRNRVEIAE
ncbi:GGDEF domain-containing protein [Chitinibacter sp. S2-10]|uniref:GGDEF domain-containing protein n=1 Tax=Chitinibacter sp. S2-10 TaxID=3373597 RepID=UPI003977CBE4